jgi:hypothetical protein
MESEDRTLVIGKRTAATIVYMNITKSGKP